jgi:hypothetical protein
MIEIELRRSSVAMVAVAGRVVTRGLEGIGRNSFGVDLAAL